MEFLLVVASMIVLVVLIADVLITISIYAIQILIAWIRVLIFKNMNKW